MPSNLWTMLLDDEDEDGKWRVINELLSPGKRPLSKDSTACTLVFTAVGEEGRRVQNLSDSEVQEEIMSKLRRAYPLLTVPEPTAIYIPRWDLDPLFKGAYTVEPNSPDHCGEKLRAPIKREGCGTIYFAGEAMHSQYKAYLQAAYFSGMEQAEEIANSVSNCS